MISSFLLDHQLEKLMTKASSSKDDLSFKLSEAASRLCQTIALESDRGLIPAIGEDIQASVTATIFDPENTLRQTLQTFLNKVSQ